MNSVFGATSTFRPYLNIFVHSAYVMRLKEYGTFFAQNVHLKNCSSLFIIPTYLMRRSVRRSVANELCG